MECRLLLRSSMALSNASPAPSNDELAIVATLDDMPRERLLHRGPRSVGDPDLLAIILGTGVRDHPVMEVATELVHTIGGVAAISRASPHEMAQVRGVGLARAARITAAFELGRRAVEITQHKPALSSAEDVYRCVAPRLAGLAQEVVLAIGVDIRNGVLDIVEIARGSGGHVEVEPRDVFRVLIRMGAAGGIVVHNHVGADPDPSDEDRELTERLREAGRFLGIPLIDHVIVCGTQFRSLAEWMGMDY